MENIVDMIKPELLILIPVLYFIGIGLKKSKMNDKWIPLVLGGIGIILAVLHCIATGTYATARDWLLTVFAGITQGILNAGCSVYLNQIIKQMQKKKENTNEDAAQQKDEI